MDDHASLMQSRCTGIWSSVTSIPRSSQRLANCCWKTTATCAMPFLCSCTQAQSKFSLSCASQLDQPHLSHQKTREIRPWKPCANVYLIASASIKSNELWSGWSASECVVKTIVKQQHQYKKWFLLRPRIPTLHAVTSCLKDLPSSPFSKFMNIINLQAARANMLCPRALVSCCSCGVGWRCLQPAASTNQQW